MNLPMKIKILALQKQGKLGTTHMTMFAIRGLLNKGYETQPGYCQRWQGKVTVDAYGPKFEPFQFHNAIDSAHLWEKSGYTVPLWQGAKPGDILYWTKGHGEFGHTGIMLELGYVAQNSIFHKRDGDGRGIRPLKDIGPPDLIVRPR